MKEAYVISFTVQNICHAFAKCGLCPLDPAKVLGFSKPFSEQCYWILKSADEMPIMLEDQGERLRERREIMPVVFKRGFVSTTSGLQLTSPDVMRAILDKESRERERAATKYTKLVTDEAKFAVEARRRRAERLKFERSAARLPSSRYDEPFKALRSLKVRRKIAAERAVLKKAALIWVCNLTDEEQRRYPINILSVDEWELEYNGEV